MIMIFLTYYVTTMIKKEILDVKERSIPIRHHRFSGYNKIIAI